MEHIARIGSTLKFFNFGQESKTAEVYCLHPQKLIGPQNFFHSTKLAISGTIALWYNLVQFTMLRI